MATLGKDTIISWLGHATFHIVTPEGRKVLIDAWVDSNPACSDEWKAQARDGLDAIFVTHGHFDHINDLITLATETGAQVVCQFDLTSWLQSKGIADRVIASHS